MTRRRVLVSAVFFVLVVAFAAFVLARVDWTTLAAVRPDPGRLIAATAVGIAFRLLGAFIWMFFLHRLGARDVLRIAGRLIDVFSRGWIGRYIPVPGLWIAGKAYFATSLGIPARALATSGFSEAILQLAAALIVAAGFGMLPLGTAAPVPGWLVLAAALLALVASLPPVFRVLTTTVYRIVRRPVDENTRWPGTGTMAGGLAFYAIAALVSGVSYVLLGIALFPGLDAEDAVAILVAVSVAAAASLVAVFAPGGIGVREATIVAFLSPAVGVDGALLFALAGRVWSIAVDALFLGLGMLIGAFASGGSRTVS
ncbi:MAG: hypothetical protein QM675_01995 [Protaetiibacter sp.]